jgi:citrate/tricarballylate utilization protein
MPSAELVKEAERQMVICNACRYCEGYCAVFPAMELRRSFSKADLIYLANLCFDCRDCYYACQYAPPHEFAINVPKVFSEVRAETYRDYTWPRVLSGLLKRNGRAVGLLLAACVAIVFALTLAIMGGDPLIRAHEGPGAFYEVVPQAAMIFPATAIALYGLAVLVIGSVRFWRDSRGTLPDMVNAGAFARAATDAFGLRYMQGGGEGCNYPGATFSHSRRWLHHLVFYGFLFDLASTSIAGIYDHFLSWQAPYPLLSWPVVLGTIGGVMLVIGTAGLLYLKWRSDMEPAEGQMVSMDVAFIVSLFLASLTGLLLLALRDTAAMGVLLTVHLGVIAALFITMPHGKFAHLFYRYTALVRNSIEQERTHHH